MLLNAFRVEYLDVFVLEIETKTCWLPWIPVQTRDSLSSGVYSIDFQINQLCSKQLGVGFLLAPADWGFFGYLGASERAWAYDPYEGAIVNATNAIYTDLPKIEQQDDIVTLQLHLKEECKAIFIVHNIQTPTIHLPKNSAVLPAACLLEHGQKITLTNFKNTNVSSN
ncbi:unnamed protein product [Didymodactylos carnosus]|uniref:Uncharacterized protein n=1 Tax=Didymodactylos carnosus TaxID=1234261 RepID=A0A814JXF4_9BILA|nr:unnamed protein product [Didymodactylos carnosus]CAF3811769.1 unnamed protein product [Didymodactylos carnosus]